MCEFRVYLKADGELREVARGVVKAMVEGKAVKLITLFGEVKEVSDVAIESVDVPNERMILAKL
ncbi:MAG: CooT family nickel-binding protein [Candidatus Nezhaarchaeota archaeon]|nr:CooT family nickel-binding protein [Candidatus Nezhaarchaeota archaeon]